MKMAADIERLYDAHAQSLFAFLLNFTRDENDTRDLLQEIFAKLAHEQKLLSGVRDERAFLIRLARNAAIDLIRRRGTRERTRENFAAEKISIFAPTNDADEKKFHDELSAALAELPEEQRAVVHLKLWNETDDGGVVVMKNVKNSRDESSSSVDPNKGDWVWRYPSK